MTGEFWPGRGHVVVVTGGAAGIGRGIVDQAAAQGAHVVIADVSRVGLDEAAATLGGAGASVETHQVDVRDFAAVQTFADDVLDRLGHVDVLVNNAGIELHGLVWEFDVDSWKRLMDINVSGLFHGLRAFLPRMVEAGRPASVVNLSSTGGLGARGVMAPYIASKFAVMGLTESLDMEFRQYAPHLSAAAFVPLTVKSQIFLSAEAADEDGVGARQRAAMQRRNERDGMDPLAAARLLFEGLQRGDLWIHTAPESSLRRVKERAEAIVTGTRVPLPVEPT